MGEHRSKEAAHAGYAALEEAAKSEDPNEGLNDGPSTSEEVLTEEQEEGLGSGRRLMTEEHRSKEAAHAGYAALEEAAKSEDPNEGLNNSPSTSEEVLAE